MTAVLGTARSTKLAVPWRADAAADRQRRAALLNGNFDLLPAALATGIAGVILLRVLRPSATRDAALRGFAFVLTVPQYTTYYVNLLAVESPRWIIHFSVGNIGVAGAVGWTLSLLLVCAPHHEIEAASDA
ncbi:MAG TPA: hypothetical protein VGN32_16600 [Ktedonobacterales bacterium]|jgi:hypothetical protein|nr:hypothetical protein [Ktedonobacterales bacterium]